MSDVRRHRAQPAGQRSSPPHPAAIFRSSRPGTGAQTPPRRCSRIGTHTHAPGPTSPPARCRPDLLHGHDSLHDVKKAEVRGQMSDAPPRHPRTPPGLKNAIPMTRLEMPEGKTRPSCRRRRRMPAPGAFGHLTSVI
jgi:hypothetical protein